MSEFGDLTPEFLSLILGPIFFMSEVTIHIGYPKTATTYFQREVFPRCRNVAYSDALCTDDNEGLITELMARPVDGKRAEEIRDILTASVSGSRLLFVQETFSVGPFGRFYTSRNQRAVVLNNLRNIFRPDNLKVIVALRRQEAIIRSFYLLYLQKGGYKEFFEFINDVNGGGDLDGPFYGLFKYDEYLDMLEEIFGRDNICVFNYEDFRDDKKSAVNGMLEFLGEPPFAEVSSIVHNKGYGKLKVGFTRAVNRFFQSSVNPDGLLKTPDLPGVSVLSPRRIFQSRYYPGFLRKPFRLPRKYTERLKAHYAPSNRRLREKWGIKLADNF